MARPYKLSNTQQIEICEKYSNGYSTTELSNLYKISVSSIRKLLVKNNIKIRSIKESREELRYLNKVSGENNHRWEGGQVLLRDNIRKLPQYKSWRTMVFKRDNFTCQNCGICGKKGHRVTLNADHVIPLSKIINGNKILTIKEALNCSDVFNLDNGRTLCHDCHKNTETWGFNYKHHERSVNQLDIAGNILNTFNSILCASRLLSINPSSIRKAAKGIYKTAGGYVFEYST